MTRTATIKKKLAVLAVALCALGVGLTATAAPASAASTGGWYWSETLAKHRLKNYDIAWNDGGYTSVLNARCSGRGGYIWNDHGTRKLFKRFVCVALAQNGKTFAVKLDVVNRFNFKVNYLGLV